MQPYIFKKKIFLGLYERKIRASEALNLDNNDDTDLPKSCFNDEKSLA